MSISHVGAGGHGTAVVHATAPGPRRTGDGHQQSSFERLRVGQRLGMSVLRQIDEQKYLVSMAGGEHVVDSHVSLEVGARVHAVVVAIGEHLELKYLDSQLPQSAAEDQSTSAADAASGAGLVSNLEARYRITLDARDQSLLEHAASRAADPAAMTLGGLYLAKLGAPLSNANLQALYLAQSQGFSGSRAQGLSQVPLSVKPVDLSALPQANMNSAGEEPSALTQLLAGLLPEDGRGPPPADNPGTDSGRSDLQHARELAEWLLNLPDDGSLAYRYGTLPVLVAGQLVELDLVMFQQRRPETSSSPVRRLVMTLDTRSFGPVQIEARALENRLMISFTGQSAAAATQLAAYGNEVRDLAARLGWKVEAVDYDHDAGPQRAARQIIDHVLSTGTVDMVF